MTWLGARSAHHGGVHLELAGHALLFSVKHTAGDHELDKVDALRAGGGGNPLTRKPHRSAKAPRTRVAKLRRIALTRLCGIPREEHHVKQLNEKVAIVTGAGQGIGKGIAMCLAKRGVKVVCTGRREAPIQQSVAEIEELGGQGLAMTCDSADRARGGVPRRPRLLLLLRPVRDRGRRQLHHAVARTQA